MNLTENIIATNTKTTFWSVIDKNTIVIPQIQRDYAQGRKDEDTLEIRKNIIQSFFNAISNPIDNAIDIDFVYGYNKNNEFIPLDGQQRLTTLFLIHWYLAKKNGENCEKLNNFRYETRQSSSDFCKALVDAHIDFDDDNLEEYIKDQRWFYHSWKKDPTVASMLTMIKAIHEELKNVNSDLWENLINENKPPITFNFLELEKFGLNDELYVKMNSRGKPLSRFENFKVWFQKKFPNTLDWQNKIDNDWTNLFWNYKGILVDDFIIDDEFMQFLNGMIMFEIAISDNKDDVKFINDNHDIALSKYDTLNCFSENLVSNITKTLDFIGQFDSEIQAELEGINYWQQNSIFELFISNKPSYSDRIRFFSIVIYASTIKVPLEKLPKSFKEWMRVSRNLIENTDIDSSERFISAVKSIIQIGENCIDFYKYLEGNDIKISFFLNAQIEEEKIKCKLISSNPNWEKEFIQAENHDLFRGCIAFLIQNIENEDLNAFIELREIAEKLFVKDGSIENLKSDYILLRASLAESEVIENIKLIENGESWRVLLKRKEFQIAIFNIIKKFKQKYELDYKAILNEIIDNYNDKNILWKYYIIKNKELLNSDASRSKFIRNYNNSGQHYLFNNEGGNWINNDNQFLLSNNRNEIIKLLIDQHPEFILNKTSDWWVKTDSSTGSNFYRGEIIWIKKNFGNYNLWLQFKPEGLILGFRSDESDQIVLEKNDYEVIAGWILVKKYFPYPKVELDKWIETILIDITEIEKLVTPRI
ncbi:DUF262 domain-containing protein [Flavobacterium sp.]|uniref:DUF262 domain-containing protein n=1 Tax=Flavobacterium sp. TaxID=239 RepID=UPI002B4B2220|nr:DUF262 domain-containing protein [Flavobacterium sp.]HLF53244.1 DUF262 domain-containing protein [Flavobacterium sp.]